MDNKLENVINRLAHAIGPAAWRVCGGVVVNAETVQEAISLLKAQEPRVMTWDEVKAWHKTELSEREPIFVEYRPEGSFGPSRWWLENFGIAAVDDGAMVCYNKYLRCWTSRPTEAQREATAWIK